MKFRFLCSAVLTALSFSTLASTKPNIVLIYADDVGFGDLSCYGAKHVETPNLDRLAAQGCQFTDGHAPASTCSPSRKALLTGVYAWRSPEGSSIMRGDAPLSIAPATPTVASILKTGGYATGIVGKWHLGLGGPEGPDWNGDIKPSPLDLGFDYQFIMAATGDRVPCVYIENRRIVGLDPADPIKTNYDEKVGNWPTGKENPELLTLKATRGHDNTIVNGIGRIGWMTGGKSALWKDEDMADTLTSKSVEFIERSTTSPFFLFMSLHDAHSPRVPHPRFHGKSKGGTRGDTLLQMDDCVDRVMETLERLNLTTNTLVVFTSDNGGVMDDGYEDVGVFGYSPSAPWRGNKYALYEGGTRIPLIARWPGKIQPGIQNHELITQVDFLATFAALAGAQVPQGAGKDSIEMADTLLNQPHEKAKRTDFISHKGGTKGPFAVRKGSWKFISEPEQKQARQQQQAQETTATLQLYNLATDPREQTNLANERTEVVQAEVLEVTPEDCVKYIQAVVLDRTFQGYQTEITTVYQQLNTLLPSVKFEPSPDAWDRLYNVDFHALVGEHYIGLQIKPVTFGTMPDAHAWKSMQSITHQRFRDQFGGQVFTVFSHKVGESKKIANPDIIEEIRQEIIRLQG